MLLERNAFDSIAFFSQCINLRKYLFDLNKSYLNKLSWMHETNIFVESSDNSVNCITRKFFSQSN